jgi:hypothetical protein
MKTGSLAHEILHSWWGNAVEIAYDQGNWAEGLTTYMADYALAEEAGADQARALRLAWLRDFNALPPERDQPLTAFVSRQHDAAQVVGYGKAAFVFHMLRQRAGEAGFAEALRRFYAEYRFRRAAWADLQRSFEATLGERLDGFFAQWLQRSGAPRLELRDAVVTAVTGGGGFTLAVTLGQDEPAYALTVPVEITTARGSELRKVELDGAAATAMLRTGDRPLTVAVDPGFDLFRRLAPGEAPPILRDVILRADTSVWVAADDADAHTVAEELAAALLDRHVTAGPPSQAAGGALLVIGLTPEVTARLAAEGLPPTPSALSGKGTARVWTARRKDDDGPLLVVEADDPTALAALARPLPHYRRDSFLVFDAGKAIERGVWPANGSALRRDLE